MISLFNKRAIDLIGLVNSKVTIISIQFDEVLVFRKNQTEWISLNLLKIYN